MKGFGIGLLWIWLGSGIAGCPSVPTCRLHLVFPDSDSRVRTTKVVIWALKPGEPSCSDLMGGARNPAEMVVFSSAVANAPLGGEPVTLKVVPAGEVIFFAEGRALDDSPLVRGCARTEVGEDGGTEVTVLLIRLCKPDPAGELPGNLKDDDCDGLTDECRDGDSCDDGLYCSTEDVCVEDVCRPGKDRDCEEGEPCTADQCNEETNQCEHSWQERPEEKDICGDGLDQNCDHVPDGCCLGNGTLAEAVQYAADQRAHGMTIGDFNTDGIPDLAFVNPDAGLGVLLGRGKSGRGDGTFEDPVGYAVPERPNYVISADLDGDRTLDLVAPVATGTEIIVLFGGGDNGRGAGTFLSPVGFEAGGASRVAVAEDFNSDRIPDLAVTLDQIDSVSVLLGNGDRTFAAPVLLPVDDLPDGLASGDFNSDGILDLAVAHKGAGTLGVLLGGGESGRGDGTFSLSGTYPGLTGARGIVVADYNADGILDLAVADGVPAGVSVLIGNGTDGRGDGTFGSRFDYPLDAGAIFLVQGDLNADGILDLVVPSYASGRINILSGDGSGGRGDGTFTPTQTLESAAGAGPLAVADLNQDSILDVAVSCERETNPGIFVLLGRGSGARGDATFGGRTDYPVGAGATSVVFEDFNADRILDLAVAGALSDPPEVQVLLGNGEDGRGDGTFGPGPSLATGLAPTSVVTGDFNGDRIPDLAVTTAGDGSISVFLGSGRNGRGDGRFAAARTLWTVARPAWLGTRDLNGDRILDLVGLGETPGKLGILLGEGADGKGTGTFAGLPDQDLGDSGPIGLVMGDFNDDRILDLAVVLRGSNRVAILLGSGNPGQGDGGFVLADTYPVGAAPFGILTKDFDSDGIVDLAVSNGAEKSLSVLPGNGAAGRGDGTFRLGAELPLEGAPKSIVAGDFDRDGIADLAVTENDRAAVAILKGGGNGGRGDGTFSLAAEYAVGSKPIAVASGDLNRDGILDLGIANSESGDVSILLGRGTCLP